MRLCAAGDVPLPARCRRRRFPPRRLGRAAQRLDRLVSLRVCSVGGARGGEQPLRIRLRNGGGTAQMFSLSFAERLIGSLEAASRRRACFDEPRTFTLVLLDSGGLGYH